MSDRPTTKCPQVGSGGVHHGNPCVFCSTRTCNRHSDCGWAEREFKARWPQGKYIGRGITVYSVDHCHDDRCEECFGS